MKLKFIFTLVFAASALMAHAQRLGEKTEITLEDMWAKYKYFPKYPESFNWMNDDQFYTVMEENQIVRYDIATQKPVEVILDLGSLKHPKSGSAITVQGYTFSEDEKKILLITAMEPIYRRSTHEIVFLFDRDTKKLSALNDGKPVSFSTFSPEGSKVAYKANNDLFWEECASGKRTQITTDGKWNYIINGGTDWVYEEEFSFTKAFEWSPDGKKLAFFKFDESGVKQFSMAMYGDLYPTNYDFKYPKAGEANAVVSIHVYDVLKKKTLKADIGAEKDQYIARMFWTQDNNTFSLLRMNRLQNHLDLLLVDATTGKSRVLLQEDEGAYIDEVTDHKVIFLKNGKEFLWESEADGFMHYYLYDMAGKLIRQVTKGEWDVTSFASLDEASRKLYFMSNAVNPFTRHLYSVSIDGGQEQKLTVQAGWHDVEFSSRSTYYMDSWSSIQSPPVAALVKNNGTQMATLEENTGLKETMGKLKMGSFEFFEFKTSESVMLNGWMIKPPGFDPSKKYPVLMFVYGGPGSQTVKDEFAGPNYFWHQMLAGKGYIVVSVDGRGTGGRGEDFKKITYADLGNLEVKDQIEAAKWLAGREYVDPARIGIWGWSFGGYLSSLCITKGADVFKTAIAVAPVTNWRFYDTIYTERYLKTPQQNAKGYDDNSPIHFASLLKGKYLLVHGTADDNVHFQNSMEWVNALVKANKQFEMAFYPNRNHGIYGDGARLHLYQMMTDFILENL